MREMNAELERIAKARELVKELARSLGEQERATRETIARLKRIAGD
jgi:hypothetical protein